MNNGFYVTLPSNSSMRYFPDNKLNHYVTRLPRVLDLTGTWEVGLVEMQYPHAWYNLREGDGHVMVHWATENNFQQKTKTVRIPEGFYKDVTMLVNRLNTVLQEATHGHKKIQFTFDPITWKVTVKLAQSCSVELSPGLQAMLGFDRQLLQTPVHTGSSVVDMEQGFQSLFVYCDLIEPRIVGDTLVPLLRIVPIQGQHGDTVIKSYENVHYLPLQQKHFQTIEIDIRDDTGSSVPFERGKVTVTLHFRRRHTLLR